MKTKIKYLVYPLAVILTSLFVIVGCSDDDADPSPEIVKDIDGNQYKTVKIGDQIWMAENLRVSKYNNGDAIPTGLTNDDWENTTEGAYAVYPHTGGVWPDEPVEGINSDEEMVAAYGKLYNWYAVNDSRGLCPEGWSVPSDDDWTQLVNYFMNEYDYHNDLQSNDINGVGNALKSCTQVGHPDGGDCDTSEHPRWDSHSTHYGFDEVGFKALPAGDRLYSGDYYRIGIISYWWSSNEYSSANSWSWYISYSDGGVSHQHYNKLDGCSIRCIKTIE